MNKPATPKKPAVAQPAVAKKAAVEKTTDNKATPEEQVALDAYHRDVPPGAIEVERELREIQSEKPPTRLYVAIREAQAKIETVRKNGNNPHFKSKYATLDEIWETVRDAVNGAGLIVTSIPDMATETLTTYIIHAESGEELHGTFPLKAKSLTPQAIGSAMTYARRYSLASLLNIVTGDGADDDGEAAAGNAKPAIDF